MARYLDVHPQDPQPRLIAQTVAQLREGALVVYPTDSCYALGFQADDPEGAARIRRILGGEQCFVIVQDLFLTETAELADVVLPAAG